MLRQPRRRRCYCSSSCLGGVSMASEVGTAAAAAAASVGSASWTARAGGRGGGGGRDGESQAGREGGVRAAFSLFWGRAAETGTGGSGSPRVS